VYGPRFVVEICNLVILKNSCLKAGFYWFVGGRNGGSKYIRYCLKPTDAAIEDGDVR
jgi:hypothetical protein